MKKLLLSTLLCLSYALFGSGEYIAVGQTSQPPVIDGILNDAAWKNCIEITNFLQLKGAGVPALRSTQAYLTADKDYLYLAFRCFEETVNPVLNQLHRFKADIRQNDSAKVWEDDIVEFFLAPDADNPEKYFHFAINSLGTVYDAAGMGTPDKFNAGAKVAARRFVHGGTANDNISGWIVEVAIPARALGITNITPGMKWKGNFCRVAKSIDETSSWTQSSGRFHDPSSFGVISFVEKVNGIAQICPVNQIKSGKNTFSCHANAPSNIALNAAFNNGDSVSFADDGIKGDVSIPFSLDSDNKAYRFVAKTAGDATETFLRSGMMRLSPGKNYKISVRVKSNYKWTSPNSGYSFLTLVQKNSGYQSLPLYFPQHTGNKFVTLNGVFHNKTDDSGSLWGLKWTKRQIDGEIVLDDISMIEEGTNRQIFANGDFSQDSKEWNIFSRDRVAKGYGNGAQKMKLSYSFATPDGRELYRSPEFQLAIKKAYTPINSAILNIGYDGLIPLDSLAICAGSAERINLVLRSDNPQKVATTTVELLVPNAVKLLPPDEPLMRCVPSKIKEEAVMRKGKKFRRYTLVFDKTLLNNFATPFELLSAAGLMFHADTAERGHIGDMEYRATTDNGYVEPEYHRVALEILEPLPGIKADRRLPIVMWVYGDTTENDSMSRLEMDFIRRKIAAAGFNMVPCGTAQAAEYRKLGIAPFPMLPSLTISGPYFPGVQEFVRNNPQYAGIDAYGRRTETIDPAVLLSADNPFKKQMEDFFRDYIAHYPNEMHVDYEFCFMPNKKGVLPTGNAVIGFSPRNIELFRRSNNIAANVELSPKTIFRNYSAEWRKFRNSQNAATLGLYASMAKKISKDVRFSVYSGYPPQSHENYGIEWRDLAPQIDLCMAGYGGSDRVMLDYIRKPFFNTGLLLMGYVDPLPMANTLTGMLLSAGSYMTYVHYTVDGKFFAGAAAAGAIAGDFSDFFLNLANSSDDSWVSELGKDKKSGAIRSFRHGNRRAIIINNRENKSVKYNLQFADAQGWRGVVYSTKKLLPAGNGAALEVKAASPEAIMFIREGLLGQEPPIPANLHADSGEFPVLRWQCRDNALLSYDIRIGTSPAKLNNAVAKRTVSCFMQISPEANSKKLYYQVRAVNPLGKPGKWSDVATVDLPGGQKIDFTANREKSGSAGKIGIWQFYSWGGGSQFAEFAVTDNGSLKIVNKYDTNMSYWTLARSCGAHAVLPSAFAGQKYCFQADVSVSGKTKGQLTLTFLDKNGKRIGSFKSGSLHGDKQKNQLSVTGTAPAKACYLSCMISGDGGPGTLTVSDLKLSEIKP